MLHATCDAGHQSSTPIAAPKGRQTSCCANFPRHAPKRTLKVDAMAIAGAPEAADPRLPDMGPKVSAIRYELKWIGGSPQLYDFGRNVAALHQLGITFEHFERGLLALAPKADVELALTDPKVLHG